MIYNNSLYYLSIMIYFTHFRLLPSECMKINPLSMGLIFTILLLGTLDIFRHFLCILFIIVGFPILIITFFHNPIEFIQKHGMDCDIIDKWPGVENTKESDECIVCIESIKIGEKMLRLKCTHLFHEQCIKEWLKCSFICPVCRSNNIF